MSLFSRFARRVAARAGTASNSDANVQSADEILAQMKALHARVSQLALRESQLRAVLERDVQLEQEQAALAEVLGKPTTAGQIERAIRDAELHVAPFPYAVVDDLLPAKLYSCLLTGIPPIELFGDKPTNKQHLTVPFALAPAYSRHVWRFMADVVATEFIAPHVLRKFREPVDAWIEQNWPGVALGSVEFHTSDGRLLLRRPGYRILPHRDPKWGFITCILYLARRGDNEAWGTQLYTVEQDEEARGTSPHWIDPARCRQVGDVEFRANRMLILLNSVGAHGAHIPGDAQPEDLERYIYQFRIGPTAESIAMLKSSMPEERRPLWAGKSVDY